MKIEEIEELKLYLEKSIPALFEEIAASCSKLVNRWPVVLEARPKNVTLMMPKVFFLVMISYSSVAIWTVIHSFTHSFIKTLPVRSLVHLFTYLSVDSFVCLLSIWLPKTETVGIFFKAKTKFSQESRIHQDSADFFFRFRMRVSFHFHQVYSIPENFQTPLKANAIIINRIHHNEKLSTNYRKIATGNGKLPKIQEISKNEPQN